MTPIPDAALDDRLGFIGTSGSGKTYGAGTAVETLLANGAKVVIVDPLGVWWGLRLTADGKRPGFTLPIFGGEHGDLPLNENAGKLIGETVASMRESCIVDLSALNTKQAERRFMLAFLEALYRHAGGDLMHVVFDEADLWAPQSPSKNGAGPQLQSLMEQIVRRGRVKGFVPWLITQRPAVVSKDVLSQADGLVAFKLTASQDRNAIRDWVRGQADEGQWPTLDAQLPTLERGTALVWLPGRGKLDVEHFPAKATFDSSRAPKRGEKKERRELKPLDLDALKGRLASIEEEAKANDPAKLKAEVGRLTRELAKAEKAKTAPPKPEIVHANADEIAKAREDGRQQGVAEGLSAAAQAIAAIGGKPAKRKALPFAIDYSHQQAGAPQPQHRKEPLAPITASDGLTGPQQRILNALAWWKAFGIEQPTNEQVGFIAGYSPGSGNFNNLKGGLRSLGLIDYPTGGKITLTSEGEAKAEIPTIELTQQAFHAAVRGKLNGPQVRLLDPVLARWPQPIGAEELAAEAGYSAGSGNFNNLRGSLRTLALIDYPAPGQVRAEDWLFP